MLYLYLGIYLIIVNAAGYLLMHIDKKRARRHQRRIPERVLLGVAAMGGSIGTMIAMYALRHKTRHRRFRYGVPAIIFLQANIILLILSTGTSSAHY